MKETNNFKRKNLITLIKRKRTDHIIYAPNYWQWFAHQRNHNILPDEINHCKSQLDLIKYLGLNVFSRNVYCDEQEYWFGGLSDIEFGTVICQRADEWKNGDRIITKNYKTKYGELSEVLRYNFKHSTLIQEKFLVDNYEEQQGALKDYLENRKWTFNKKKFIEAEKIVGNEGLIIAGEVHSPLKMLHLLMGSQDTVFFIIDYPKLVNELLKIHEETQLALIRQMTQSGVKVVMAMDNLDTMFHPPQYVEKYSASFYERASKLCHENDALFMIHACGNQKDNLKLISSLGVDGLEGVAFPPLGDVELEEAMENTHDGFVITGGISAIETRNVKTREEVFTYVKDLFRRMKPYKGRFIFSASCNTSIETKWDTIKYFRDAWNEYKDI